MTFTYITKGLPKWLNGKESPAKQETRVRSMHREDPLEKEMVTRSSILAWKIPWLEEPASCRESDMTE